MSMHLLRVYEIERCGGAVWERYCRLRDAADRSAHGSSAQAEYFAFCHAWSNGECDRLIAEAAAEEAAAGAVA